LGYLRGEEERIGSRAPGAHERRVRCLRASIAMVAFALLSLSPIAAFAQTAPPAAPEATPPASTSATSGVEGYDLDFTLPTAAKAGCQVCHGDPNLARLRNGVIVNYYVDPEVLAASPHVSVQCTGCHLDFAFAAPHEIVGEWQLRARADCKNCHRDQFIAYGKGAHRVEMSEGGVLKPDQDEKPLCGDCHGSHAMVALTDDPAGQRALHADGWNVCGRCHEDYWDNYNDYYHGRAYKRGAADAPACWDCHDAHDILNSDDRDSSVNERHIVETCQQCHSDANEEYVRYAAMIHGTQDAYAGVFVLDWYIAVRDAILGIFGV
jgi:hypothetical protein